MERLSIKKENGSERKPTILFVIPRKNTDSRNNPRLFYSIGFEFGSRPNSGVMLAFSVLGWIMCGTRIFLDEGRNAKSLKIVNTLRLLFSGPSNYPLITL